jgi:hypothetical protein
MPDVFWLATGEVPKVHTAAGRRDELFAVSTEGNGPDNRLVVF